MALAPVLLVVQSNGGYEIKRFTDEKGKLRSRPQELRVLAFSGFQLYVAIFSV